MPISAPAFHRGKGAKATQGSEANGKRAKLKRKPKRKKKHIHISELRESKFLKKEECGNGILVTIRAVTQENVAASGAPEEQKWCLWTDELEKPMVLNSTNGQIIAGITGSEDSAGWVGHQIELYHEKNIAFGGKLVGGIRARAPGGQPQRPQRPAPLKPARPAPQRQQPRGIPVDADEADETCGADNPFNEYNE